MKNTSKVVMSFIFLAALKVIAAGSENPNTDNAPLVQPEYKLQEDRKAFEEIRSQIPEVVKDENDELAFMEKLFSNPSKKTSEIRDQFSKALRKKRDRFQKDMRKKREVFVKKEREERKQALKGFDEEKARFRKQNVSREESKEFYDNLDRRRKDFYSGQRERREEFEAQFRDDRKNFEDYSREKQNDFNARLKEFTEKQKELQKNKK